MHEARKRARVRTRFCTCDPTWGAAVGPEQEALRQMRATGENGCCICISIGCACGCIAAWFRRCMQKGPSALRKRLYTPGTRRGVGRQARVATTVPHHDAQHGVNVFSERVICQGPSAWWRCCLGPYTMSVPHACLHRRYPIPLPPYQRHGMVSAMLSDVHPGKVCVERMHIMPKHINAQRRAPTTGQSNHCAGAVSLISLPRPSCDTYATMPPLPWPRKGLQFPPCPRTAPLA